MDKLIYLDNSATTKISKEALETYVTVSNEHFGNPSSLHFMGSDAEKYLKDTRAAIREVIGVRDGEIVFTASGTEANNLALFGRAYAKERYKRGAKILTTEGEHASVSGPVEKLRSEGFKVAYLPTRGGEIDLDALRAELTPDVILVSVMMVNNETGARYDVEAVAKLTKSLCPEAVLHVDATQSFLKMPINVRKTGIDLLTISSHKIHGPKGVGALYLASEVVKSRGISPVTLGGGQEGGYRSGTENVPAVAAFGTAVRSGYATLARDTEKMESLRAYLLEKLASDPRLSEISPTLPTRHAPHILNITLPGIKSETMLHHLSSLGICVSSGSACSSHGHGSSPALVAFGRSEAEADTSLRVSFSSDSEKTDVDALCEGLALGLSKLVRTVKSRQAGGKA